MNTRLSKSNIDSFCGDVLPLQLISDEDISQKNIKWTTDSDCVQIRTFSDGSRYCFSHGVLLTLMKPGKAKITAEMDEEKFCCDINIREMMKISDNDTLEFFRGDFHDHTHLDHNKETFPDRKEGFPIDYLRQVEDEGKLDACVVSDHAILLTHRDFFMGFTDAEKINENDLVVFAGAESDVTVVESDRFGYSHKNAGEIVTLNADNCIDAFSWEAFYDAYKNSPFAVAIFAHPQVMGWDTNGIWNFNLDKNSCPELKRLIKAVEMGNGCLDKGANIVNEHFYSLALDHGFRVSTTNSSDCHGPKWGYDVFPGKTIIMAPEKSKEAFLDALLNNRVYSCDSGNVKLAYTVNGHRAPCDLPEATNYLFHVELSQFEDDEQSMPVICKVISDYGTVLKTIDCSEKKSFCFEIDSDSARYFFLKFVDRVGRKTRSVPVWTGRDFDEFKTCDMPVLDKSCFSARDVISGTDAKKSINNNPRDGWVSSFATAEIIIDMHDEYEVLGVGHYPTRLLIEDIKKDKEKECNLYSQFVSEYRISLSIDGENFEKCAEGIFRTYGGEEIAKFEPLKARYVKFEALSSSGKASDIPIYADAPVSIGELTIFGR